MNYESIIASSTAVQINSAINVLVEKDIQDTLASHLNALLFEKYSVEARTNFTIALFLMGQTSRFEEVLRSENDLEKSYLMSFSANGRVSTDKIIPLLLTREDIRDELLNVISLQISNAISKSLPESSISTLERLYVETKSAREFACIDTVLKNLAGFPAQRIYDLRGQRLQNSKQGRIGSVYLSKELIAFAILQKDSTGLDSDIAVSVNEVSINEFLSVLERQSQNSELPKVITDVAEFATFFDKLNTNNGFQNPLTGKAKLFSEIQIDFSKSGFRPPTAKEWAAFSFDDEKTIPFFGRELEFIHDYAWLKKNSEGEFHDCGLLPPNKLGLKDTFGSCQDFCILNQQTKFGAFGGFFQSFPSAIRQMKYPIADNQSELFYQFFVGIRIVRSLPD